MKQKPNTPRRFFLPFVLISVLSLTCVVQNLRCTYDSTPPGDERIHDSKPLIMIDATGFNAQRGIRLQYTDSLGSTTLETRAEKTDASGRFLYPLYMTRGTRTYSLTIIVDQNGDGTFAGAPDKTYTLVGGTITSDSEIKKLQISIADFTP